mmetsp:Transcript_7800/g.17494  ORF Transcript_7800/g.17494 Transcript_7800/m.17494 type:complete len:202 (-) Transcript_7800:38-643(-)
MTTLADFRRSTGLVRPPANHGCPPVEIVPGLWTAHFHDIETPEQLAALPAVTCVVNAATDKCLTGPGSYGPQIRVVTITLLDDPDALKKVDAMQEGEEKVRAREALPSYAPEECAGDAKKDFEFVNSIVSETAAQGGATLIHCHASLSRSVAFILAYLMKTKALTALEAVEFMKPKWDAVWPNDKFVLQLIEYEQELKSSA